MTRLTLAVGVLEALRMYASLISCCRAALAEKHRVDWAPFRHVIATPAPLLAAVRRQVEYILKSNSSTQVDIKSGKKGHEMQRQKLQCKEVVWRRLELRRAVVAVVLAHWTEAMTTIPQPSVAVVLFAIWSDTFYTPIPVPYRAVHSKVHSTALVHSREKKKKQSSQSIGYQTKCVNKQNGEVTSIPSSSITQHLNGGGRFRRVLVAGVLPR